jgi:hypothetical protein
MAAVRTEGQAANASCVLVQLGDGPALGQIPDLDFTRRKTSDDSPLTLARRRPSGPKATALTRLFVPGQRVERSRHLHIGGDIPDPQRGN